MTFVKLIDTARVMELSETQAKGIDRVRHTTSQQSMSVNKMTQGYYNPKQWVPRSDKTHDRQPKNKCRNCAQAWPHVGGQKACPAAGKECRNCKKR